MDFMQVYGVNLLQSWSFYVSVFQYICIVKPIWLTKCQMSPKVCTATNCPIPSHNPIFYQTLADILLTAQYLMPLLYYMTFRILAVPSVKNGRRLLKCLGQYEMFYDTDGSTDFCYGLEKWTNGWLFCRTMTMLSFATGCNLMEMFLVWKCVGTIKETTANVRTLLSLSAYNDRQRDHRIMFSVIFWQWILEVTFVLVYYIHIRFTQGMSLFLDNLFFVFVHFYGTLINSFYLFEESHFRHNVQTIGLSKAVLKALTYSF